MGAAVDQVGALIGIRLKIIKFIGGKQMDSQLIAPIENAAHGLEAAETVVVYFIAAEFCEHIFIAADARIPKLWQDALPIEDLWNR